VRVREGGRWKGEAHTELAPGAGDGSGADEVGGVVEEVEDTGGGVEADPVEEVPAAALLHLHRRRAPRAVAGGGRSQRRSRSVSKEPCWLVEERNGEARGREEEERKPTELVSGGAVAAFVQILLWCLWPPNSTDSSPVSPPRRSAIAFLASNHARATRAMPRCSCPPTRRRVVAPPSNAFEPPVTVALFRARALRVRRPVQLFFIVFFLLGFSRKQFFRIDGHLNKTFLLCFLKQETQFFKTH
jgi:hypothetical protein